MEAKPKTKQTHSTVFIPSHLVGFVIGKGGSTIKNIQHETGATIWYNKDNKLFHIRGDEQQQVKARIKMKETASFKVWIETKVKKRSKRMVFIDTALISEENEFRLQSVANPAHHWAVNTEQFKLCLTEEVLKEERAEYSGFDGLREEIHHSLSQIHKEQKESHLKVDMWCHFGHTFIENVDEDEEHVIFTLKELQEKLTAANVSYSNSNEWRAVYHGGVESLEFKNLERVLSFQQSPTELHVRHDILFYSPSCRQIRVKIFVSMEGKPMEGVPDQTGATIKDLHIKDGPASLTPTWYITAQCYTRFKADIFMPACGLDCHFVIRTTYPKRPKSKEEEEEERILGNYLDGMTIKDGDLQFPGPEQLPNNFDFAYRRKSIRRAYPYKCAGEGFSVFISEELAKDFCGIESQDETNPKTDIHLHSDEWDRLLEGEDWEPEQIVSKLPEFLTFIRNVQRNVSVPEPEVDED